MTDALNHAQEIADQILARAKELVLTGEKEHEKSEISAYMELLDEHEPLIDELTDLKFQLDDAELASPEFEKIKATITEITEIYKNHRNLVGAMQENAKSSYKEVKQGQRLSTGYNLLSENEVTSSFDIKQ
ncbi:MAG: hypothetical protein FWF77_04200 [Defluviitaleaceae bacterium]|nr:hypothetical protein [Defluviitaleaceae bacterium]